MTVAQQVRRLSSFKKAMYHSGTSGAELERGLETAENELANELEQARAKLAEREKALTHAKHWIEYLAKKGAELEQQVARETPGSQTLKEHVEALTAQTAAADKRIAELEGELGSVREALVFRENENLSLRTSLDSIVSENWRLFRRLTESEAAVDEANEKRRTETNALNTRFEAMSSRAVAAEKLLADVRHAAMKLLAEVRQSLPARISEKRTSERRVVDGTVARGAVDKKHGQLQNSLLIKLPAELVALLNAEGDLVNGPKGNKEFDYQPQYERPVAEGAREKARANCAELRCESEIDLRHNGEYSERAKMRHTEMLLASIFTS